MANIDTIDTAFHSGEILMQQRAGVRERLAEIGDRVMRDRMPEQHRELFRKLPTLLVGSVDAQRRPWASILAGEPGFISDPDDAHLRIDALPDHDDLLAENLATGASVGLLGIEPQTRRRNRMNGRVVALDARGFEVEVEQSFGNCPQYIQARTPSRIAAGSGESTAQPVLHGGATLADAACGIVRDADTLFIASTAPKGAARNAGVDVSHRGGRPGFIEVDQGAHGTLLVLPDYRGNFFFNTLGNIVAHPPVGLLFIDYASGGLLQIGGRAVVVDDEREVSRFDGAQRLLYISVERQVWRPAALPLRWSAPQFAPQLAPYLA